MSESPYLEGIRPIKAPMPRPRRTLLLWIVLIVLFLAIYQFLTPGGTDRHVAPVTAPQTDWAPVLVALGIAFLVCALAVVLKRDRVVRRQRALVEVDMACARGDFQQATGLLRAMLVSRRLGAQDLAALTRMGRCAEARGDFADAEAIFERAADSLPAATAASEVLHGSARLEMQARRGFALAAQGQLDRAREVAGPVGDVASIPVSTALNVRTHALILARRRDPIALEALLDQHATLCETWLCLRDRVLLRALQLAASGAAERRTVATTTPVRDWIARACPEAIGAVVSS